MPIMKLCTINYPDNLHAPDILIHADAQDELKNIFDRSGNIPALRSAYRLRLVYLSEKHQKSVVHTQWFEALKRTNGLFSMRFKSMHLPNLRIIFYFMGDTPCLIASFIERNKADYEHAIDLAQKRRKEIEED